jgi:GxxExxY protein
MAIEQPRFRNSAIPENLNELSNKIIGCAFTVSNTLGIGFLEKVYENALAIELKKSYLHVNQQFPIQVIYDNFPVGDYFADLVVENSILVELKTVNKINELHQAQCINYLNATGFRVCLLLNFARTKIEVKRFVL